MEKIIQSKCDFCRLFHKLRGHDMHFLRLLLFLVGRICPLMQEDFL